MSDKQELKNKARLHYMGLDISTGSEGFPDAPSFIYGFMEGYEIAMKENEARFKIIRKNLEEVIGKLRTDLLFRE